MQFLAAAKDKELMLAATGHQLGASARERRRSEARAEIQQTELARNTTAGAIGVALAHQIVALHGGRMWWEPVQPEGTRFVVELPFARGNLE